MGGEIKKIIPIHSCARLVVKVSGYLLWFLFFLLSSFPQWPYLLITVISLWWVSKCLRCLGVLGVGNPWTEVKTFRSSRGINTLKVLWGDQSIKSTVRYLLRCYSRTLRSVWGRCWTKSGAENQTLDLPTLMCSIRLAPVYPGRTKH